MNIGMGEEVRIIKILKIPIIQVHPYTKGIHNMLFHSFLTALANFTTFSFGSLLYFNSPSTFDFRSSLGDDTVGKIKS